MQSLENITVRSCDAKICLTYIARKLGMWFACITLGRRKEGMYRMIATLQTNIRGERESVSCRTEVIYKYRIILLLCGRHWSLVTPRDNPSHQSTRYTHTYIRTYIHTHNNNMQNIYTMYNNLHCMYVVQLQHCLFFFSSHLKIIKYATLLILHMIDSTSIIPVSRE